MAQQSITLQTSDADVVSGDVLGRVNFAASNESSGSEAKWIGASIYAEASGEFTATVNPTNLVFATSDADGVTARYKVTNVGHLIPNVTSTYNIGSSALKINNIFSATGTLDRVATTGIQLTGSASQSGLLYINNSNLISSSPNMLFSNADLASPKLIFKASGTTTPDLSLNILTTASGTTSGVQTLSIQGSAGELFSITDVLDSGTIFSVNDISGLSLIEADASGVVTLVRYGTNVAVGDLTPTQKLHVGGNLRVSGAYYDSLNSPGTSGQVLVSTAVGTDWKTLSEIVGVDGVGISGYTARWIDAETISSGIIFDNGTNVGIGDTNPSDKLVVNGRTRIDGTNKLCFGASTGGWADIGVLVANSGTIVIRNYDGAAVQERMRIIGTNGNVGIGTTSPTAQLQINTASATATGVIVRGAASQTADLLQIQNSAGTTLFDIDAAGSISGVGSGIFMQRVGIGLSNPTTSLQVALPLSTTNYIFKSPSGDNLLALQTFPTSDRMQLLLGSYNGTATPTLASIADPNTGLQFPGSDVLRFVNNGVETVSIIANGSVGIGTNDPTYRFDLRGTGWVSGLFHVGSPFIGTTLGAGATYEGYIGGHNSLIFSTNQLNVGLAAGEKMRLTAAGYFGINTNSPTAQLQINTSGINATGVIVRGSASQSADLQQWQNSAGAALVRVDSAGSISGVASGIFMGRVGIANASPQNLLTIGSGIGTGLNVNSTAGYGLGIHHSGIIVISPETAGNNAVHNLINLTVSKPAADWGGQATIDFNVRDRGNNYPSRTSARITAGDANGDIGRGIISFATALNSGTAPATAMTIINNQNVGIGTINPTARLQIVSSGTSSSTFAFIAQNTTPTNLIRISDNGSLIFGPGVNQPRISVYNPNAGDGVTPDLSFPQALLFYTDYTGAAAGNGYFTFNSASSSQSVNNDSSSLVSLRGGVLNSNATTGSRYTSLSISPTINQTTGSSTVRGIWYSPTVTSASGVTHRAIETNRGDILFQNVSTPLFYVQEASGNVGIGTTSPTAKLHIETGSATATGVIVRGAASQTADLLQIQNSAGTTLLDIDAAGSLSGVGSGIFMQRLGVGTSIPSTRFQAGELAGHYLTEANADAGVIIGYASAARIQLSRNAYSSYGASYAATNGDAGLKIGNGSEYAYVIGGTSGNLLLNPVAGKVSIGTINPAELFTVYGSNQNIQLQSATNAGSNAIIFADTAARFEIYRPASSSDLRFKSRDGGVGDVMTLTYSTANVGIGTTSPTQRLHVSGNMRLTGAFFDSLNVPGASGQVLVSTSGGVEWRTSSGGIDGTGSANYLARWIDADTLGTGIVYDNGTNVGIGTASPTQKLDINGSLITNASVYVSGNNRIAQIYNDGNLKIDAVGGYTRILTNFMVDGNVYLNDGDTYGLNASTNSLRFFAYDSSTHGNIQFFSNNSVERVRIDSSGNLGIGTTAPSGKLHIETGAAATTGIIVRGATSQTADFQQWQNSAGTMLASVTKDGNISYNTSSSLGLVWGTASLLFNGQNEGVQIRPYTGSYVGFSVKGQTAQSYDLTQWKDSTGTVLARVDAAGSISGVASGIFMNRVGIGTSTPISMLQVVSPTGGYAATLGGNITVAGKVEMSAASPQVVFVNNASNANRYWVMGTNAASDTFEIRASDNGSYTAGTNAIAITQSGALILKTVFPSGDIGIGTTSPTQKLDVRGSAFISGALYDSNNSAGTNGQVLTSTATGTDWKSLSEIVGVDGVGTSGYIARWIDGDTIGTGVIYDNGTNVGVRTTAPSTTLDVRGTGYFSESVRTSGTVVFASGNTGTVGVMQWNDGEGTVQLGLKGGNVNVELAQDNVVLCYNGVGSSLSKGQVVYASGAQGQRPSVNLALATSDLTSARTIGIVDETIGVGAEGFVATFGVVTNLNTSALTAGSGLWLSATTPGAITMTRPVAPNHGVFLGWCLNSHVSAGRIFVNVQNGVELDEVHDVLIQNVASGDVLQYDSSNLTWRNRTRSQAGLVEGVGVSGYVPRWTGTNLISSGLIYDNNTNVGVGTSSPSYRLHIVGGSMYLDHNHVFYTSDIRGTSGLNLNTGTSANVFIANGGGNVGVGTTSPTAKLHVVGSGQFTAGIYTNNIEMPYIMAAGRNLTNDLNLYALDAVDSYLSVTDTEANGSGVIIVGDKAGVFASGVRSTVAIGNVALASGTNAPWSVFIGRRAGYTSESLGASVAIGASAFSNAKQAIPGNDIGFSVAVGYAAGANARLSGRGSTFIGASAGQNTVDSYYNTFVGINAGYYSSGLYNTVGIGPAAFGNVSPSYTDGTINSEYSVGIGPSAGSASKGFNNSIVIGKTAGAYASGNNNIYFGVNCGLRASGSYNFELLNSGTSLLGYTTSSNKLHINRLIAGDFETKKVAIGNITSANLSPDATLEVLPKATTDVGVIIQGVAAQTADLFQVQNSAGATLLDIDAAGSISGVGSGIFMQRVGVGTSTPDGALDVVTDTNGSFYFGNKDDTFKVNTIVFRQATHSSEPEGYAALCNTSITNSSNSLSIGGGSADHNAFTSINLVTASDSSVRQGTTRLRIISNGNVGIATATPVYPLDVRGSGYFSNGVVTSGRIGINITEATPTAMLDIRSNSATVTGVIVRGASAQTADLLQIQNSAGATLLDVDFAGSISGVGSGIFGQNLRVANIPAGSSETDVVLVKTDGTFVKRPSSSLGVGGGSGISNEDSIINALIFG